MATLDEIFEREFNQTRASLKVGSSIYDLKLTPRTLPRQDFYSVQGIKEDYYSKLNDTNVYLLPRGQKLERRLLTSEGQFRVRKDGSYFTVSVSVPKNSLAVVSNRPIGLPFSYKADGFDYVDYMEIGGSSGDHKVKRYIYIIPKQYLYKVHFNALALSSKKMKSYQGIAIKSWNLGVLNLCIIPYKPNRTYANTVILLAKVGTDFSKEISSLVGDLVRLGVISEPYEYLMPDGRNIGIEDIEPAYNFMEYVPHEVSPLSSLTDKDLEDIIGV